MNALRLNRGVPAASYEPLTGMPLAAIAERLGVARDRGLLDHDPARLAPTELGRRFLNDLLAMFDGDHG